jgi:hypothetical protein
VHEPGRRQWNGPIAGGEAYKGPGSGGAAEPDGFSRLVQGQARTMESSLPPIMWSGSDLISLLFFNVQADGPAGPGRHNKFFVLFPQ